MNTVLQSSVENQTAPPDRPIRVCYIDTSLRSNLGHYANSCRHIAGELRRRNIVVDIYGHRDLPGELAQELGAVPYCRHACYDIIMAYANVLRPVEYWLARASFLRDLQSISERNAYSLIFVNSVLPAQLAAIAIWLRSFQGGAAPPVAVEFGAPTGDGISDQYMHGWWQQFPRLYRKAGRMLKQSHSRCPFLFTFDALGSSEYARLLGCPVATMPAVHVGSGELRARLPRARGRLTVAFLGHQRPEKGYHHIPAIIRQLRRKGVPATLLVHNGDPTQDLVSEQLRSMASDDPDLLFEQRTADSVYWQSLLERSDLVVLPYDPTRYRASYSAVAVEAAGEGIPMVVPTGTTMETLVNTGNGAGVAFDGWDSNHIAAAIEAAVGQFGELAGRATAAALNWRRKNGAVSFVDRLLEATQPGPAAQTERNARRNDAMNRGFGVLFAGAAVGGKCLKKICLEIDRLIGGSHVKAPRTV